MKGLELLQKYPLTNNVIKDWFHQLMVESFKDPEIAEEFKEFILEQGIENDKLGILITSNPRMLFDVFDENEIYLNIFRVKNIFMWSLYDIEEQILDGRVFNTRKEAELFAVEAAFEILENKLSQKVEE